MDTNNKLLNIESIFKDTYIIPVYQRNYAWGKDEIETLLEDLEDAFISGANDYFLGNLVVEELKESESTKYGVVDGQQRLTTLYMVLCYLGYESHRDKFSMELRPESNAFLKKITENFIPDQEFKDAQTLYEGFMYIKIWFEKNSKEPDKEKFLNYLLKNVQLARVVLPPEMDANRYFEIMNNRGQQLSQVDVVKARLMAKLENSTEQTKFALIWDACSQMDVHVLSAFSPEQRKELVTLESDGTAILKEEKELAFETLNINNTKEVSKLDKYTLDEALTHYGEKNTSTTVYEEEEKFSDHFGRAIIPFPYFLLHTLKLFYDEQGDNEELLDDKKLINRFSELILKKENAAKEVKKFIIFLFKTRFLFDTYIIRRIGDHDKELNWQLKKIFLNDSEEKLTIKQYNNTFSDDTNKTLIMLQSMLRTTYTTFKGMHWITHFLKKIMDCHNNKHNFINELINELRKYTREKVCQDFKHGMPKGTSTPHIIFTYLDFILWEKYKQKYTEFRFHFRNSVEHFYPQNPSSEMKNFKHLDPEVLDCIGNLALVTISSNSRFSNQSPEEKAKYESINQSIKLQMMADKAKEWNENTIREHCEEMLELLRNDLKSECNLPEKCSC